MKNRLIYSLIVLMVVSLVGIISIQVLWISDAIEQQTNNFKSHVNDALNRVNTSISEDEAIFFIDEKFGGLDSLVKEVRYIGDDNLHSEQTIIENTPNEEKRIEVKYDYVDSKIGEGVDEKREIRSSSWVKKLEIRSDDEDSVFIEMNDIDTSKLKSVTSFVEHFTFEKSLSGILEDRIAPDSLRKKLKQALKEEGIYGEFSYAVYNDESKQVEGKFKSSKFDEQASKSIYSKELFPNDRLNRGKYKLNVQFENEGSYVWKNVRLMAFSSGIFTILILLSFGYALYFIYKQKKISQIKNDFINNMTHELKTPLATISLATSSIKHPDIIGNPEEVQRFTAIIEHEKQRMNAHIERVLEIAALDKGEIELNKTNLNIVELIQQSVDGNSLAIKDVKGEIDFQSNEKVEIKGDSYHLRNVLNNVIDNGIKYRASGKLQLKIELIDSVSVVKIRISDNGIGMDSTTKKLAFDKFYRAETGNIHATKGFGLGLSYVKNIIEAHGGKVEIESKLGEGTTVIITLTKS